MTRTAGVQRWPHWAARAVVWGVLLWPVARLALRPQRVIVEGQAYRMHVRLEATRAAASLARYAGIEKHVALIGGRAHAGSFAGDPICLAWNGGSGPPYFHVLFDIEGRPCLPPITVLPDADWGACTPEPFYLPSRGGARLTAFVLPRISALPTSPLTIESAVWIYRDDRWNNILNISDSSRLELERKPSSWCTSWLEIGRNPPVQIIWDPARESFVVPATLPATTTVLPLLPDITLDNWRPPP